MFEYADIKVSKFNLIYGLVCGSDKNKQNI